MIVRGDCGSETLPVGDSGDILLILPPFAAINRPSLGLTLLEQIAGDEGCSCDIYYAALHLARALGEDIYSAVSIRHGLDLMGERLFSQHAFPDAEVDHSADHAGGEDPWHRHRLSWGPLPRFDELTTTIGAWLEEFRELIRRLEYRVFGLSTMFSQNLCCVCLARIIKEERPDSLVLIGGVCDANMARGMAQLSAAFDYIFIGEAEATFRAFCQGLRNNTLPPPGQIAGPATADLDQLACPDYDGYFKQLSFYLPESTLLSQHCVIIPYETSRGCWWGQKHQCTFCGLDPDTITSRVKDSRKVLADLRRLRERYGRHIHMADNIMPMQYFDTLLPEVVQAGLDLNIFYEQKSNLGHSQLRLLKAAGVSFIQPGIEALSTALLRKMHKGVSGAQNIRFLRDCRSLQICPSWNLLFNFPGDADVEYEETLALIRKLRHLNPPMGFRPISFDRFSPYFREPDLFGIKNLRPLEAYAMAYPSDLASEEFAYHFVGDADVVEKRNPGLVRRVADEVQAWIVAWQARKPILSVTRFPTGEYVVYDTRHEGNPAVQVITRDIAVLITHEARAISEEVEQAMAHDWVIEVDGIYVGIAVASAQHIVALRGDRSRATAELLSG
jgi:ribosomal peptide maturation radical SAM protein 1